MWRWLSEIRADLVHRCLIRWCRTCSTPHIAMGKRRRALKGVTSQGGCWEASSNDCCLALEWEAGWVERNCSSGESLRTHFLLGEWLMKSAEMAEIVPVAEPQDFPFSNYPTVSAAPTHLVSPSIWASGPCPSLLLLVPFSLWTATSMKDFPPQQQTPLHCHLTHQVSVGSSQSPSRASLCLRPDVYGQIQEQSLNLRAKKPSCFEPMLLSFLFLLLGIHPRWKLLQPCVASHGTLITAQALVAPPLLSTKSYTQRWISDIQVKQLIWVFKGSGRQYAQQIKVLTPF